MNNLLNNNSQEMNTIVETFLIQETAELIYDNDKLDKWNELISELGLEGQQKIVTGEKSPIPFMPINSSLKSVFETLLPRKVQVSNYDVTPIPVEILSLVALSKNENYFDKMEIWYDDKSPDPACIGMRFRNDTDRQKGHTWNMEYYLIGKWGDVRKSFEELKEMAVRRYRIIRTNELNKYIKNYQRELEDMDIQIIEKFGINNTNSY